MCKFSVKRPKIELTGSQIRQQTDAYLGGSAAAHREALPRLPNSLQAFPPMLRELRINHLRGEQSNKTELNYIK